MSKRKASRNWRKGREMRASRAGGEGREYGEGRRRRKITVMIRGRRRWWWERRKTEGPQGGSPVSQVEDLGLEFLEQLRLLQHRS